MVHLNKRNSCCGDLSDGAKRVPMMTSEFLIDFLITGRSHWSVTGLRVNKCHNVNVAIRKIDFCGEWSKRVNLCLRKDSCDDELDFLEDLHSKRMLCFRGFDIAIELYDFLMEPEKSVLNRLSIRVHPGSHLIFLQRSHHFDQSHLLLFFCLNILLSLFKRNEPNACALLGFFLFWLTILLLWFW